MIYNEVLKFVNKRWSISEIDEKRSYEIKWCLTTSSAEKHIRQAARNLFHRLNTSHTNAMSREEYLGAVKSITDKAKEQKLLMAAGVYLFICLFLFGAGFYLFICLFICLVQVFICLFVCLFVYVCLAAGFYLFICFFVYLFVYLTVHATHLYQKLC